MKTTVRWAAAAIAAALLSSCSTAPKRIAIAPPPRVLPQELPYQWTQGNAPQAHKDALAAFGPLHLKPGEYKWVADIPKEGDAKVVIDRLTQLFYVYRGHRLVGVATASTGKKGKETPLGFWKVFRKKKLGYSRKYDNAPMPYMQMYDHAGIAFHAGPNPGYPASHGCVRLPKKFAEKLYGLTDIGTEVVIEG
ncbi:MAG TPA: L,D-transpeptidase family protein [Sphingomicrobium sp.]|jgi:lipoprotein-anchoring transpeptidase ErfK/SrfK|nr:L,D-transpeptidase family protein [Sphingomicrobium sp.]